MFDGGKLKIEGDLMFARPRAGALRTASWFRCGSRLLPERLRQLDVLTQHVTSEERGHHLVPDLGVLRAEHPVVLRWEVKESMRTGAVVGCGQAGLGQCVEEFVPADRYDVIIFSESIYYARRPERLLSRYASALTSEGVMIVSMCQNRWQDAIWTTLQSAGETVHSTAVTSEQNLTWHVRVLRP